LANVSSPLDRIEANALRSKALLARLPQEGPDHIWRDDVLALVNVAKAAEASAHRVECVLFERCGDCDACRFNEALAALDKDPSL
jgi:hypothetical protein